MSYEHPIDRWPRLSPSSASEPAHKAVAVVQSAPLVVAAGRPARLDVRARRQWNSQQLLGDEHEIEIAHADSIYRLRLTSLGKLILTK